MTTSLKEVDSVEILTLLDNSIDLLLSSAECVRRLPRLPDALTREGLVAEHGFAALVTGQVHRTTSFELGLPFHHALISGTWQPDPYIHDDQAIVVHVKDKGLLFEPYIAPTVAALKEFAPAMIVPALHRLDGDARDRPGAARRIRAEQRRDAVPAVTLRGRSG